MHCIQFILNPFWPKTAFYAFSTTKNTKKLVSRKAGIGEKANKRRLL